MGSATGLRLTFGDPRTSAIDFGPIEPPPGSTPPHDMFECPITVTIDGSALALGAREGMEGYALANLRANLRTTDGRGRGTFWFGDHDFGMLVEVTGFGNAEDIAVALDLPSLDRWGVPLPSLSTDQMRGPLTAIEEVEDDFGPLTGSCAACRVKDQMFHPDPYRNAR